MSIQVVDRRKNSRGKSSENRQRLLKRVETQIQKALPDIVKNTKVKEITDSSNRINIPIKGIKEPNFTYAHQTGNSKNIYPGNKEYAQGDLIKKPPSEGGSGSGQKGSNQPGESEDDFVVSISRDEFLDYFFAELELPEMVKKHLNSLVDFKRRRAGYVSQGSPSKLNIVRSYQNSLSRRMASTLYFDKKIKELNDKLVANHLSDEQRVFLENEIIRYTKMKLSVAFMEETDLRFNNFNVIPVPVTSAVMFCVMDVSGSMGEKEKDIAKRFFMLLYLFLTKQYEQIDIVFIRHHTEAKEVSEEVFFNSKESGGTMVSPALELMKSIIKSRYSSNWNVYAAQVSDGDVWNKSDAEDCGKLLFSEILPSIQYMTYIEVCRNTQSDLWDAYTDVKQKRGNLEMAKIHELNEIWSVFKVFFKKKVASHG